MPGLLPRMSDPRVRRVGVGVGYVVHGICFELGGGSRQGLFLSDDQEPLDLHDQAALESRGVRWWYLEDDEYIVEVSGLGSRKGYLAGGLALRTNQGREWYQMGNLTRTNWIDRSRTFKFKAPEHNYVNNLLFKDGMCVGIRVVDQNSGCPYVVRCDDQVLCSGEVQQVQQLEQPCPSPLALMPPPQEARETVETVAIGDVPHAGDVKEEETKETVETVAIGDFPCGGDEKEGITKEEPPCAVEKKIQQREKNAPAVPRRKRRGRLRAWSGTDSSGDECILAKRRYLGAQPKQRHKPPPPPADAGEPAADAGSTLTENAVLMPYMACCCGSGSSRSSSTHTEREGRARASSSSTSAEATEPSSVEAVRIEISKTEASKALALTSKAKDSDRGLYVSMLKPSNSKTAQAETSIAETSTTESSRNKEREMRSSIIDFSEASPVETLAGESSEPEAMKAETSIGETPMTEGSKDRELCSSNAATSKGRSSTVSLPAEQSRAQIPKHVDLEDTSRDSSLSSAETSKAQTSAAVPRRIRGSLSVVSPNKRTSRGRSPTESLHAEQSKAEILKDVDLARKRRDSSSSSAETSKAQTSAAVPHKVRGSLSVDPLISLNPRAAAQRKTFECSSVSSSSSETSRARRGFAARFSSLATSHVDWHRERQQWEMKDIEARSADTVAMMEAAALRSCSPPRYYAEVARGGPTDWNASDAAPRGSPEAALFWGRKVRHLFRAQEARAPQIADIGVMLRFLKARTRADGADSVHSLLGDPTRQQNQWYSLPLKAMSPSRAEELRSQGWVRAWHGCKLEAVYSILYHGRLFESRDRDRGERYLQNARGIYVHKEATAHKADNYVRFVPLCGDGVFWAAKFEVLVNPERRVRVPCQTDQWVYSANGVQLAALWFCGRTPSQMREADPVSREWVPHMEANPLRLVAALDAAGDAVSMESPRSGNPQPERPEKQQDCHEGGQEPQQQPLTEEQKKKKKQKSKNTKNRIKNRNRKKYQKRKEQRLLLEQVQQQQQQQEQQMQCEQHNAHQAHQRLQQSQQLLKQQQQQQQQLLCQQLQKYHQSPQRRQRHEMSQRAQISRHLGRDVSPCHQRGRRPCLESSSSEAEARGLSPLKRRPRRWRDESQHETTASASSQGANGLRLVSQEELDRLTAERERRADAERFTLRGNATTRRLLHSRSLSRPRTRAFRERLPAAVLKQKPQTPSPCRYCSHDVKGPRRGDA